MDVSLKYIEVDNIDLTLDNPTRLWATRDKCVHENWSKPKLFYQTLWSQARFLAGTEIEFFVTFRHYRFTLDFATRAKLDLRCRAQVDLPYKLVHFARSETAHTTRISHLS